MEVKLIKKLTISERKAIDCFLESQVSSNFFQSTFFFESCLQTPKTTASYIIAYQNEEIVGLILFIRQIQFNLPVLRFLSSRNIIWGGPIAQNNDLDIINSLFDFYQKTIVKVIYTQIRNLFDATHFKDLLIKKGFLFENHLNILINLDKTTEELWKELHTKRRNEVRKASKENTFFEVKNDLVSLNECYQILKEVYNRAKLPLPDFKHFEELFLTEKLLIFTAIFEQKIIGCMLCLSYKNILFDYYAGAYSSFYSKYPNDLITWEVFVWAKKKGFQIFDFGGAGKPDVPYGVRDYKIKFGGELVNYGRFEKIHFPFLYKIVSWGFGILRNLKK